MVYRVCDVYREFSKTKLSCLVLFSAGKFGSPTFLLISAHFWSVRGMNSAEYLPKLYSLIRLWNVFNIRYFSFCCIADIYNSRSLEIKNTRSSKKHYFPPKYVFEDALLTSVIKSLSTSVWSCRYNEVLCVYLWVVAWRIGALWQLWPQN